MKAVVVPAAGLGTRFLPATKTVPKELLPVRQQFGGSVLCAFEVPQEDVSKYGVFDIAEVAAGAAAAGGAGGGAIAGDADDCDGQLNVKRVRGMVEKPDVADAPSNFVATGRYLMDRAVFDALRRTKPGKGGEIQITDAIELMITEGHPVHIVVHDGKRHDLGNPGGFIRACVDFALDDPEYGPSFEPWLKELLKNRV